jgi:hypothetical protein
VAGTVVTFVALDVLWMPLTTPADVFVLCSNELGIVVNAFGTRDALDVLGVAVVRIALAPVPILAKRWLHIRSILMDLPRFVEEAHVFRGSILRSRIRVTLVRVCMGGGDVIVAGGALADAVNLVAPGRASGLVKFCLHRDSCARVLLSLVAAEGPDLVRTLI